MTTMTDLHQSFNLLSHTAKIQRRGKCAQSFFIKVNQHIQKTPCAAEKDHPNIDTLTTLHQRNDTDNGIIIRAGRGHGEPPLRRSANLPDDPADKQYKLHDAPAGPRRTDHSPTRTEEPSSRPPQSQRHST